MILPLGLVLIVLAAATPSAASPAPGEEVTTAEEQAQFDLLKKRRMERLGIAPSAAGIAVPPGPVKAEPSFAEKERERATEFNKQFVPGAYEGMIGFSDRCKSADGCNKLATANLIKGAYEYVDMKKEIEAKTLVPDSEAYRNRHAQIKSGMKVTMEQFRPQPGGRSAYENDFIKISNPIVTKIFTPAELMRYAERNAASSDSPAFYTYLGQTLNGNGPPAKARAAFDAALQRDPKNDAAMGGRAEARLNMRDYEGAVRDAVAALKMNPDNKRAFVTLKFAEGRVPPGTAEKMFAGPGLAASEEAAAGPGSMPPGGASPSALGNAGASDAARRSDALTSDARRSLSMGDSSAALALLGKALAINPSNAEALGLTAMARIRLKDFPGALEAAEAGLTLAPNNPLLLDAKANALNSMKDYRGALAAADRAIAANPKDGMAYFNRAWALSGLHNRAEALAALQTAASLNPQFAPAFDAASSLPLESDILMLFPGESTDAQPAPPAEEPVSGRPPWLPAAGLAP